MATKWNLSVEDTIRLIVLAESLIGRGIAFGRRIKAMAKANGLTESEWKRYRIENAKTIDDAIADLLAAK